MDSPSISICFFFLLPVNEEPRASFAHAFYGTSLPAPIDEIPMLLTKGSHLPSPFNLLRFSPLLTRSQTPANCAHFPSTLHLLRPLSPDPLSSTMSENARELRRQRMQDYVKDLVSAVLNAHSHTYNVDYYLMETWKADFKKAIEPSGNVWFYYSERNYNAIASRLYDIAHTAHDLDSFVSLLLDLRRSVLLIRKLNLPLQFFTNSDRKRVVSDFYTPVKILLKLRDAGKIDVSGFSFSDSRNDSCQES